MSGLVERKLREAKAFLNSPRRWVKGSLFGSGSRLDAKCACTMGACAIAAGGTVPGVTAYGDMIDALRDVLPEPYISIPTFNDDPATTLEDVHALFDRAINRLANGQSAPVQGPS